MIYVARMASSLEMSSPELPDETSRGSSVSTGLQQEYEELLKYAVVTPKIDLPPPMFQTNRPPGSGFKVKINAEQPSRPESSAESSESSASTVSWPVESPDSASRRFPAATTPLHHKPTHGSSAEHTDSTRDGAISQHVTGSKKGITTPAQHATVPSDSEDTTPKSCSSHNTLLSRSSPVTDVDLVRVETLMDEWCLDLKRNVLAEFSSSKMKLLERYKDQLCKDRERHSMEVFNLQTEIENLKEVLNTYEKSTAQKDLVIHNMTTAIQKQRTKYEQLQTMAAWRLQHNDIKREKFASKLASKHYERTLANRILTGWRGVVESKWKQRVEKACQARAQEVCIQLTEDYEERLQGLQKQLDDSRTEVAALHQQRDAYEETMKKAFMRGVCALNMEAMTMFRQDGRVDSQETTHAEPTAPMTTANTAQSTIPRSAISNESAENSSRAPFSVSAPKGVAQSSKKFPQTKTLHVKATAHGDIGPKRGSSFPSTVSSVLVQRHSPTDDMAQTHAKTVERRLPESHGKGKTVRFDKSVTARTTSGARTTATIPHRPPNIKVVQ